MSSWQFTFNVLKKSDNVLLVLLKRIRNWMHRLLHGCIIKPFNQLLKASLRISIRPSWAGKEYSTLIRKSFSSSLHFNWIIMIQIVFNSLFKEIHFSLALCFRIIFSPFHFIKADFHLDIFLIKSSKHLFLYSSRTLFIKFQQHWSFSDFFHRKFSSNTDKWKASLVKMRISLNLKLIWKQSMLLPKPLTNTLTYISNYFQNSSAKLK